MSQKRVVFSGTLEECQNFVRANRFSVTVVDMEIRVKDAFKSEVFAVVNGELKQ